MVLLHPYMMAMSAVAMIVTGILCWLISRLRVYPYLWLCAAFAATWVAAWGVFITIRSAR